MLLKNDWFAIKKIKKQVFNRKDLPKSTTNKQPRLLKYATFVTQICPYENH